MKIARFLLKLAVVLALLTAGAGSWLYLVWMNQPLPVASAVEFRVSPGMGVLSVARLLSGMGVAVPANTLALAARLEEVVSGRKSVVQTGYYGLAAGTTPRELLRMMAEGKTLQIEVRLIEGWTFREWRRNLAEHEGLEHLTTHFSDAEIMEKIGMKGQSPEGMFFPDTYRVSKYSSDLELFRYAAREMRSRLEDEWRQRKANLPYQNPYEALIMASIVEKETGRAEDREMVAGVFVNRLRMGMRLDTDPSVIYGLGEAFDGTIHRSELRADTPYNTYIHKGLPPTPIATPSLASLKAALHPARTSALFFVARGDGSSHFSDSLAEHNRAVDRYIRRRGM